MKRNKKKFVKIANFSVLKAVVETQNRISTNPKTEHPKNNEING